jgi:hypothetical protein
MQDIALDTVTNNQLQTRTKTPNEAPESSESAGDEPPRYDELIRGSRCKPLPLDESVRYDELIPAHPDDLFMLNDYVSASRGVDPQTRAISF